MPKNCSVPYKAMKDAAKGPKYDRPTTIGAMMKRK